MSTYHKEENLKLTMKLRGILEKLPEFCTDFFRGIADTHQIKTRIVYADDLRIFFYYLYNNDKKFKDRESLTDFYVEDLDNISAIDIEKFSEFLSAYQMPHWQDQNKMVTYTNAASGKMRKLSTLRTFYKYYYKKEIIKTNPTVLVDLPKIKEKPIIRLEPNESADLLDAVESGDTLTEEQKKRTKMPLRDLAIISLLLGTGIRISECVGIDVSDINFKDDSFLVTRKGGNQAILYMPGEVRDILQRYYEEERKDMEPLQGHENAFFLSSHRKRIGVSNVQKMLKKYTDTVVSQKKISPHKLRSTYGTNLYNETGDIYLVAEVLGHSDINTTKKHYTAINEDRKRSAAKVTKLRKE
ncbi:MAG: tyrosine-type recombinase/integrase [Eubacteriaceae bacterium]|nr:tyrosine-type recombinase/integrase [Eubacteriaceae bacterium]